MAWVDDVVLSGAIPGTVFILPSVPDPTWPLFITVAGLRMQNSVDFTLVGTSVTFGSSVTTGPVCATYVALGTVPPPIIPPITTSAGLSITQAIEIADRRTERRGGQELDLRAEFWLALGELTLEKRFPWRYRSSRFITQVNVQSYDLSTANANGFSSPVAPDYYEMKTVYRVDGPSNLTELPPILGEDSSSQALEATVSSQPSGYFFLQQGANYQVMYLGAPADGVYPIRINYWAGIGPNPDNTTETIPLLPQQAHFAVPIALERSILRFLYGEEDPRYEVCDKRYQLCIGKLSRLRGFTTNRMLSWASTDGAIKAVDASGFPQDDNWLSRSD